MPRPLGDHDTRRRDVAAAVFGVLGTQGFGGLTMRAVAAELGATTGAVTHYFASKRDLQNFALDQLRRSVTDRPRAVAEPGMAALRAAVLGMLPLTPEAATANRIWISSWDVALADPELTADYADTYARSRARLERLVRDAQKRGELTAGSPKRVAAAVHAFALGLIVQAVLDPDEFPPSRQSAMTDAYLTSLAPTERGTVTSGRRPRPARDGQQRSRRSR